MHVGASLIDLARAANRPALAFVGTAKNVGKTIAARSVIAAAQERGERLGCASIGRDGESVDSSDAQRKPRLFFREGAWLATARGVLPRSPACEILDVVDVATAAGRLAYVRVRGAGFFELVGPPTASGIRTALDRLHGFGCERIVLDGALDRVAALAGGNEAIVVSIGASGAQTLGEMLDDARALIARLALPGVDITAPAMHIPGALTAGLAAQTLRDHPGKQIVVRDPTRIAVHGRALLGLMERVALRVERPLCVIAVTVASIGRERSFEPRALLHGIARATGLPSFDVYAGAAA